MELWFTVLPCDKVIAAQHRYEARKMEPKDYLLDLVWVRLGRGVDRGCIRGRVLGMTGREAYRLALSPAMKSRHLHANLGYTKA